MATVPRLLRILSAVLTCTGSLAMLTIFLALDWSLLWFPGAGVVLGLGLAEWLHRSGLVPGDDAWLTFARLVGWAVLVVSGVVLFFVAPYVLAILTGDGGG